MEYAESVRARMVRRMLGPNAVTARRLAAETGIAQPTLSRWLRAAASIKDVSTKPPASPPEPSTPSKRPQDWTALERAQAVLAASQLSDAALGEFLRRQGLHREQLEEWKRALEEALAQPRRDRAFLRQRSRTASRHPVPARDGCRPGAGDLPWR